MSITQHTLVHIYHPMFRKGYQDGRQHYFREPMIFIDKQFMESLQFVFEQMGQEEEAKKREEGLYYSVGQLVGKMSGGVIPRQSHEDQTQDLQEAFLLKVEQEYGTSLVDAIRQFWARQDHLAQELDADTFESMISCRIASQGGA